MENYETLQAFENSINHYERLFRITPEAFAYDLHPNYLATRYALKRAESENLPSIGVQHHHAHIAACMAENDLPGNEPVIGVSFDGTGFGDDEAIWGGEFFLADYYGYQRPYHLDYVPLPGGDQAIREPWRIALAWMYKAGIPWEDELPAVKYAKQQKHTDGFDTLGLLRRQINTGLNAPLTSSMGRLFDAAASLIGIRQQVNYEAQAAIEMEALVDRDESGVYPIQFTNNSVDSVPMIGKMVSDYLVGVSTEKIAARFHNSIAEMVLEGCIRIREEFGVSKAVLSGGVWQNMTLLEKVVKSLIKNDFRLYIHHQIPANDGGLALGQALIASHLLVEK
jgi:hydrogenase maturation protein HypF